MPCEETFELEHLVDCPIDAAWKILFSPGYDKFYLERYELGKCQEEESNWSDDGNVLHRKVRITPYLGDSYPVGVFLALVKKYFDTDEVSYLTVQQKEMVKDEKTGVYTMKCQNIDHKPYVEALKSDGVITLHPVQDCDDKCVMQSKFTQSTDFPWYALGAHSAFMAAARYATNEAFTKMVSVINEYYNDVHSKQ